MEEIRVNRLPLLTYRYLKTNDTPLSFDEPKEGKKPIFSDTTYVTEGGSLPEEFRGASIETVAAAKRGAAYTITIPEGVSTTLSITAEADEMHPGFKGQFIFHIKEGASLNLIWRIRGGHEKGTSVAAAYYEVEKNGSLKVSRLESGMDHTIFYDQRHAVLHENATADFLAAELGGENIIVHSYGKLIGDNSSMTENAIYVAKGSQHLDFFYHIDQIGKKTNAEVNVNGALDDEAKKVFRSTLNFIRGCSGSVGDEGDYAVQLSPRTKNISIPLLLCTEDDVQGNHASSSGQLNQDTLYFIMSRGFSLEEARRIIVESIIRPIIDKMDESVRDEVLEEVRTKLDSKENK